MKEKIKNKELADKDVFTLRQDSRKNIITMIKHFVQKCPVNYALVRPAICIDPRVMAGYPEKAQEKMKKRVNHEFIKLSGAIYDLKITKEMRTAATSARAKYMQYLESERSKEKTETKQLKRKALEEEIDFLKQKKMFLQTDMHQTNEKANELANGAEKSKDINLFIESHELRKTISEKEIKINTLDVKLNEKSLELKDI
ncbi:hypothetical protein AVEN_218708-1 [Araneus ventricosus]|uniref:Uncharacterized protein n=1 Tax=Araneus ventricosus TaxID=182803 RepID=A0A4Y2B6B3_ARAVE|nr:hypothetical protein AVEN_218708-1 [Araneus ventricosus]